MNTTMLRWVNRDLYREGANTPRWEKYIGVDVGADSNVLDHQIITARLIRKYGKYDLATGKITNQEYIQLRIAGLLHDIPEYIGSDISYDEKHTVSKDLEYTHWGVMIDKILKWNTELIEQAKFVYAIDSQSEHPLFPVFKIYEKLGYLQWAILASKLNSWDDTNTQWLINNVIGNNLSSLIATSSEYDSIQVFLTEHRIEIFRLMDIWARHTDSSQGKNTAFKKAREDWEQYIW